MKQPRPEAPPDVPDGTVQLGGPIGWFSASLHITADDLEPEAVSRLLGAEPTAAQTRGVPLLRADGTQRRTPTFGRWSRTIKSSQTDEWDIAEVIRQLFVGLPDSVESWAKVRELGTVQVSLGLSLSKDNEDFALDAELIQFLGQRGVKIWFDVYGKEHET